ncbi:MAG: ABC transporter ATP-binding protein [Acidobacteria bacterium]|nr:ABC transporter ATP-binding protein [Acidobacteriota bacterium]MBI3655098.1 ABC transporter ATP-binding protein [Acidobacteriota bacterium]
MIELKGISKGYRTIPVVENISFEVYRREFLSILGPSGSGKTTLLRLIAGLERPDSGEITIDGLTVSSPHTMMAPLQRRVGMIFQDLALWPHMTVVEHIEYGLRSKNISREAERRKVEETLRSVNLQEHGKRYPYELSGGEKQRLAIARTISLEPRILLLDEPLSSLDPLLKQAMQRLLCDLRETRDITCIYVTHDPREVMNSVGRMILLNKGKIERQGFYEDIRRNPASRFVEAFLMGTKKEGVEASPDRSET